MHKNHTFIRFESKINSHRLETQNTHTTTLIWVLFLCVNFIENLYRFIKSYSPSLSSISSNSLRIDNINNALFNVLAQHTHSQCVSENERTIIENCSFFNRILFYDIIVLFCLSSIELLSFMLSHLFFFSPSQ